MNSNNDWDDFSEVFSQSLNYSGSCSPDTVVSIDSSESYLITVRSAYETENEMSDLSTSGESDEDNKFESSHKLSSFEMDYDNSTSYIDGRLFELPILDNERLDEWTIDERFELLIFG
jgi:hypothetical protein